MRSMETSTRSSCSTACSLRRRSWASTTLVVPRSGPGRNTKGYSLALHRDGKLVCQVGDGSAFAGHHLACGPILWDGLWPHVARIGDRSGATGVVTLYVDGTKRALCTSSVVAMGDVSNEAPLRIGQQDPGFDQTHTLNGCIDEVELFDRALTPLEVLTLYSADRGGKWKFQAF